jgi:hypothetical protein
MIWSVPVLQDSTIYELDPYRNTGLDEVLELRKDTAALNGSIRESRILMKFDLSYLGSILSDNDLLIDNISASLKMYTVQESELPTTYTIEAKALAGSWENGSGYTLFPVGTIPSTYSTDGVTWLSTGGTGSGAWEDITITGTTSSYNRTDLDGGGVWYTASIASQSFTYKSTDAVNINVTDIVKNWHNNMYSNNGFLISFKHDNLTGSNVPNTNIQFYSAETNTVYQPQLYISWTGSVSYNTGSLSVLTYSDSPIIYQIAPKFEYQTDTKVRVLLGSRPKYPRPGFTQNSAFVTLKLLPSASYYQIVDAHSDDVIIPYSEFTKINTNTEGSYFYFYTTMLYPERYYKFEIKSRISDIDTYFSSQEFLFKIVK